MDVLDPTRIAHGLGLPRGLHRQPPPDIPVQPVVRQAATAPPAPHSNGSSTPFAAHVDRQPADGLQVVLVDDHQLVREGLRLVLESTTNGITVVGEAESAGGAFALIEQTLPDVILLDLTLGESDGIPLLRALRERHPSIRVLVVSMHRDAETVRQALLAGAAGYVAKGARASELVDAIRAVARGDRYVHSSVAAVVVDDSLRWLQSGQTLSPREREILSRFAEGQRAAEIGRELGISEHTVRRHVANLTEKLGVRGLPALRRYAAQNGLLRARA
jgi:DNA-binding NarL/FixJ family response regulator